METIVTSLIKLIMAAIACAGVLIVHFRLGIVSWKKIATPPAW